MGPDDRRRRSETCAYVGSRSWPRRRPSSSEPVAAAAVRRHPACRPSSARRRARPSTSWPGRGTSRTARPTRRWTGSPTSRRRAAARSPRPSSGPRTRRTRSSRRTPSSTTSSRRRATQACGWSRGGFVQPVNVDLFKNYADIFPALKDQPYNTVDGVHYGVPHGRGSNLLMWRTDQVTPAPDDAGRRCSTRRTRTRSASTTLRCTSPTPPSCS